MLASSGSKHKKGTLILVEITSQELTVSRFDLRPFSVLSALCYIYPLIVVAVFCG